MMWTVVEGNTQRQNSINDLHRQTLWASSAADPTLCASMAKETIMLRRVSSATAAAPSASPSATQCSTSPSTAESASSALLEVRGALGAAADATAFMLFTGDVSCECTCMCSACGRARSRMSMIKNPTTRMKPPLSSPCSPSRPPACACAERALNVMYGAIARCDCIHESHRASYRAPPCPT